mmetsp:Transcript_112816/g.343379  ORF Transcript_112816/g.343379 Transcript_112816/m.343379 type:complete len:206 (+) Transcript_112816:613-1230(+)
MKAKLLAERTAGTSAGASSRRAPMASSTSAAPLLEEAARLPCFTTEAPAPAATSAEAVETLKVSCPSPPVPTMSMTGPASRETCTGTAFARMTSARACTMPEWHRSRLSKARKAPVCAGVASPAMSSRMASLAAPVLSSPLEARAFTASLTAPPAALGFFASFSSAAGIAAGGGSTSSASSAAGAQQQPPTAAGAGPMHCRGGPP